MNVDLDGTGLGLRGKDPGKQDCEQTSKYVSLGGAPARDISTAGTATMQTAETLKLIFHMTQIGWLAPPLLYQG